MTVLPAECSEAAGPPRTRDVSFPGAVRGRRAGRWSQIGDLGGSLLAFLRSTPYRGSGALISIRNEAQKPRLSTDRPPIWMAGRGRGGHLVLMMARIWCSVVASSAATSLMVRKRGYPSRGQVIATPLLKFAADIRVGPAAAPHSSRPRFFLVFPCEKELGTLSRSSLTRMRTPQRRLWKGTRHAPCPRRPG